MSQTSYVVFTAAGEGRDWLSFWVDVVAAGGTVLALVFAVWAILEARRARRQAQAAGFAQFELEVLRELDNAVSQLDLWNAAPDGDATHPYRLALQYGLLSKILIFPPHELTTFRLVFFEPATPLATVWEQVMDIEHLRQRSPLEAGLTDIFLRQLRAKLTDEVLTAIWKRTSLSSLSQPAYMPPLTQHPNDVGELS